MRFKISPHRDDGIIESCSTVDLYSTITKSWTISISSIEYQPFSHRQLPVPSLRASSEDYILPVYPTTTCFYPGSHFPSRGTRRSVTLHATPSPRFLGLDSFYRSRKSRWPWILRGHVNEIRASVLWGRKVLMYSGCLHTLGSFSMNSTNVDCPS